MHQAPGGRDHQRTRLRARARENGRTQTRLWWSVKCAPHVRLLFRSRQSRNMSADRGRPEAAGQRPERREQPITDMGYESSAAAAGQADGAAGV